MKQTNSNKKPTGPIQIHQQPSTRNDFWQIFLSKLLLFIKKNGGFRSWIFVAHLPIVQPQARIGESSNKDSLKRAVKS